MPNGDDRNVVRLEIALARYFDEFGVPPTQVAITPGVLANIVHVLGSGGFAALARRVQVSTDAHGVEPTFTVSGEEGTTQASGHPTSESRAAVRQWIGYPLDH